MAGCPETGARLVRSAVCGPAHMYWPRALTARIVGAAPEYLSRACPVTGCALHHSRAAFRARRRMWRTRHARRYQGLCLGLFRECRNVHDSVLRPPLPQCLVNGAPEFLRIVRPLRPDSHQRKSRRLEHLVDQCISLYTIFTCVTAIIQLHAQSRTYSAPVAEQEIHMLTVDAIAPAEAYAKATIGYEEQVPKRDLSQYQTVYRRRILQEVVYRELGSREKVVAQAEWGRGAYA
jgi:hypothetical protein